MMSKNLIKYSKSLIDVLNRDVVTIVPTAPVSEATYLMMREEIGSLVVVDDQMFPVGIVTDRDLLVSAIAEGKNPEEAIVEEVMTKNVVYVEEETNVLDILSTMSEYSIRRIPVTKDGRRTGIVSVDDLRGGVATELVNLAMAVSSKSKIL
jgi:CBS domain-containing protein